MIWHKKAAYYTTSFSLIFFSLSAFAEIDRVRVINESDSTIYIHTGGFAPSSRIEPGDWKIFYFPFTAHPPEKNGKSVKTSMLVATAGGRWITQPNGYTYLDNPNMTICLDYNSEEHRHKTGNRVWTIKQAAGFDNNCKIKGYTQLWNKPKSKNIS